MKNMPKTKNNFKRSGFTLLEVIIVVMILAILAAVALPRYFGALERSRAAEGVHILGTLLAAQERYVLEPAHNGLFANGTIDNLVDFDVTIPAPKHFLGASNIFVSSSCAAGVACATVKRSSGTYKLFIDRDGTITCSGSGSPTCHDAGF
ncbi:MAG: type II secretion system protein [Candidatus Omnitrophica bacterium]|nr:type II secretion system protein [Candidatus Omnitrophota bacterium]